MEKKYDYHPVIICDACDYKFNYIDEYDKFLNETVKCPNCHNWFVARKGYISVPRPPSLWSLFDPRDSATLTIAYMCIAVFFIVPNSYYELVVAYGGLHGQHLDQVWRWVTHAFLHGGFIHLLFNMLALVSFGLILEKCRKASMTFQRYLYQQLGYYLSLL